MAASDEPHYVFRDRHPERDEIYALYDRESGQMRRDALCLLDLPYGPHSRMTFDLFPGRRHGPVAIFFHGGYWQSLDKRRFSFIAGALLAKGFSVALPNYPLAPEMLPGRIAEAATSSISVILRRVTAEIGVPSCWLTTGHSAGGHLAVWAAVHALRDPVATSIPFAGAAPVSGIFDLRPLVGTSLNTNLELTIEQAVRLSPIDMELPPACYRLAVGGDETQGFLDQTAAFAGRLRAASHDVRSVALVGMNHYTILQDFLSPRHAIASMLGEMAGMGEQSCREAK